MNVLFPTPVKPMMGITISLDLLNAEQLVAEEGSSGDMAGCFAGVGNVRNYRHHGNGSGRPCCLWRRIKL